MGFGTPPLVDGLLMVRQRGREKERERECQLRQTNADYLKQGGDKALTAAEPFGGGHCRPRSDECLAQGMLKSSAITRYYKARTRATQGGELSAKLLRANWFNLVIPFPLTLVSAQLG